MTVEYDGKRDLMKVMVVASRYSITRDNGATVVESLAVDPILVNGVKFSNEEQQAIRREEIIAVIKGASIIRRGYANNGHSEDSSWVIAGKTWKEAVEDLCLIGRHLLKEQVRNQLQSSKPTQRSLPM